MNRTWVTRLAAAVALLGLTVAATNFDEDVLSIKATLVGFQEVTPKLTGATGRFVATVRGSTLSYTLSYSGLSSPVTQAHIHFGQGAVNGGIFLWLCGTSGFPGPANTPTCPASGTVSRTVGASDIVAPAPDQGLAAGDFASAVRIIRSGVAYANVHSTRFGGGEIRGQIRSGDSSD